MVVLDTDHRSLLERINSPEGQRLNVRPEALENEDPVTTIISYEEQVRGWMAVIANANSMAKQIEAFGKLHQQLKNYCSLKVLDFSDRAAIEFQRLRKEYRRLATHGFKNRGHRHFSKRRIAFKKLARFPTNQRSSG